MAIIPALPDSPLETAIVKSARIPGATIESIKLTNPIPEILIDTKDEFWDFAEIDATKWNKLFPYQLMVLKNDNGKYRRALTPFTLPIPPQDLTISTPFAINTSVTLGGYVEEHNGAPIRIISLTGTTGVWPGRSKGQQPGGGGIAGTGILAGTIQATTGVLKELVSVISGTLRPNFNVTADSDFDGSTGKETGYYQFRLLQMFLESYVASKKQESGKNLRLAFAIWKDDAVYVVTPITLELRRTAASPWEYTYTLQFRAWRRITLDQPEPAVNQLQPSIRDPNLLSQALNRIQSARRVLQKSISTIEAFRGDVNRLLVEPIRETGFFIKDAIGVGLSLADLPTNIVSDLKGAIVDTIGAANAAKDFDFIGNLSNSTNSAIKEFFGIFTEASILTNKGESQTGTLQQALISPGIVNPNASLVEALTGIIDDPGQSFDFLDVLNVSQIKNLPPQVQGKILNERIRVRDLNRLDFEEKRNDIQSLTLDFSDSLGLSGSFYDKIIGRTSIQAIREATEDDFETLHYLNSVVLDLNKLSAYGIIDDRNRFNSLEFVAGLASSSGIAFTIPRSKFSVPFPFGSTLEMLSARYLGTPDRWHEMAVLNGLKEPFVDEVGFSLNLLTNGKDNQVAVSSVNNLKINQLVTIASSTMLPTKRRIISIDKITDSMFLITVDGDLDLDKYKIANNAVLQAFLPDTVNSQMTIYIPSDQESNEDDFKTKEIPNINKFDTLLRVGGIDLLLTSGNDLAVTPDGDIKLAAGLTNLVQRARIALSTPKGSLIRHPTFGLSLVPGVSTTEIDAKTLLASIQNLFSDDLSFNSVNDVSIIKKGPSLQVKMSIEIAGINQVIPITFDIRQ